MAAVSLLPTTHSLSEMSFGRRIPLSTLPNATNSPRRVTAAPPGASKRSRSQSSTQRDAVHVHGQLPPAKKQMTNKVIPQPQTPSRRQQLPVETDGRVFTRRGNGARPTAFDRRLLAARDSASQSKRSKERKAVDVKTIETVKQWQNHYRAVFPTMVFYFESVPEDIRWRFSKQIAALGAVR